MKAIDIATAYAGTIKIKNSLRFSSNYSDILSIEGVKDNDIELYTNLPSILGIDGTLPDVYVENYVLYNRNSKQAVLDFFDIFHERIAQLTYMFLKRHDLSCISQQLDKTQIGQIMLKLSGYQESKDFYDAITSNIPIQFAIASHNLFWQVSRSAFGLKVLLSSFFEVPITINEFYGKMMKVNIDDQTRIGTISGKYNVLNISAILDRYAWNAMDGILIIVGPLKFNKYIEFFPKMSAKDRPFSLLQKMKDLINIYTPIGIRVHLKVVLDSCEVPGTLLNRSKRLGKDAFVFGNSKECSFTEVL